MFIGQVKVNVTTPFNSEAAYDNYKSSEVVVINQVIVVTQYEYILVTQV